MKRAIVTVDCCAGCPFVDHDGPMEEQWGKYICTSLDKEVDGSGIDEDCELEDE